MSARKDVDGMGMPTDELPIRHPDDAHTTPLPAIGPDWPRAEPVDGSGPGRGGRPSGSAMGGRGAAGGPAGGRGAADGSAADGAAGGAARGEGSGRLPASVPAGLCGVLVAVLVLLALGVVGAQVFSVAHGEPGPGAFAVGAQLAAALSGAVLYRLVSTRTGPIRPAATLALLALTGAVLWYFWWA